ncbi:MAG: FecR family protein, partial [Gammaproteobacteria bacterium]|nr:FecR family protein [Gammaproteobacteria bacterium]
MRLIFLLLLLFSTAPLSASEVQVVGEVLFVSQHAWAERAEGAIPLKPGDAIRLGDILETAPNAQLHLKMIDHGFLALRPGTRLHIRDYRPPVADDDSAGIKLELLQGALRSITGHIGEAQKERFRLNTPLAAIGIRGTDFSVNVLPDSVQASVFKGMISMSPFVSTCLRETLGPCLGEQAVLAAASLDTYIELRAGADRPSIIHTLPLDLQPTPEEEHSRRLLLSTDAPANGQAPGLPFTLAVQVPSSPSSATTFETPRPQGILPSASPSIITLGEHKLSLDRDLDGLDALQEQSLGTNPFQQDTDADGLPDAHDPRPTLSDRYRLGSTSYLLPPAQLSLFRLDNIQIERIPWGSPSLD